MDQTAEVCVNLLLRLCDLRLPHMTDCAPGLLLLGIWAKFLKPEVFDWWTLMWLSLQGKTEGEKVCDGLRTAQKRASFHITSNHSSVCVFGMVRGHVHECICARGNNHKCI